MIVYTTNMIFLFIVGGLSLAIFAAVSIADKYKEFMKEEDLLLNANTLVLKLNFLSSSMQTHIMMRRFLQMRM